jgi:DinB family protein
VRSRDLLLYAYGQIQESLRRAVDGLTAEQLTARVRPDANTIAWLAWHLVRIQDDHVAEVSGWEQVWTADGWVQRFGLPFDDDATGYGFSPDEVAATRIEDPQLLLDYAAAVHARTTEFLEGLSDDDLDRIVDRRWDPPVTLGVRLVSVLSDDLQHIGQAAYLRGLLTEG